MDDSLDELEARQAALRRSIRDAAQAGDGTSLARLRDELRTTQNSWDELVQQSHPAPAPSWSPAGGATVRERVHQILTILDSPAAPTRIAAVHEAFLHETLVPGRLGSLRRDEERAFTAQPFARPYYLCPALAPGHLSPVRGLLAVSTWPLEQRIMTPTATRTDLLTQAVRIAEQIARMRSAGHEPTPNAWQLLQRLSLNIPGAYDGYGPVDPDRVLQAARAEAETHAVEDADARRVAAAHARKTLTDPARLLFGA
ncbi:hypothetical protein ACFQ7N_10100 [Streptomyces niveus]|uniref:hypothetical protein n=1 Tax=Streptomyces niveus TaxID=193462 RepID=UPI0036952925